MKFFKLCQNEFIKTIKKTSTKLMIILTLLAILGALGFTSLIKFLNKVSEESSIYYGIDIDETIASLNSELTHNTSLSEQSKGYIQAEIDMYQLAKDNDVYFDNYYGYWKVDILYIIENEKYNLVDLKLQDADNAKISKQQSKIDNLINVLKNDDYSGYIELQKQSEKASLDNKEITQKEYDLKIELLDITQRYEINKTGTLEDSWKNTVLDEITTLKNNLLNGIDSNTGKVLTVEKKQEQQDAITLDLYRLENNIPTTDSMTDYRTVYDYMAISFTSIFLSIMMIMITGSSISTEVSKGTIKFWTITPNKRWKIMLSKIVTAVFILLIMTLVISILSDIIGTIVYRDNPPQDYLYVKNGEVLSINHNIYTILYNLVNDIDIFMFMLFALMLSTVTRSTATSVGISIATYVGSGTIMSIINAFVKMDFIKFIPFNNLGLVDKIFPNSVSYITMETASTMLNQVTIGFSVAVLAVCAILMLVTMFDSFNKRDII